MSFHFVAAGTRDQVCGSLDRLSDQDISYDNFGIQIRDAIVDAISQGTDLEQPADQRYQVSVSGHASRGGVVTLNATIRLEHINPQPPVQEVSLNETAVATDNLLVEQGPGEVPQPVTP